MIRNLLTGAAIAVVFMSCSVSRKMSLAAKSAIFSNQHFANAHTGILIYDPGNDKILYDYQSDKYFVPASNTKLASCYVAMKYLGDTLRGIQYEQINDSTVLIAGTGDPSVLHPDFSRHPVFDFLNHFKEVRVYNDDYDEFLGSGWSWNDYTEDYMAPRSSMPLYGNIARIRLENGRVTITPGYFQEHLEVLENIQEGMSVDRPWATNEFMVSKGRQNEIEVPFVPTDSVIRNLLADTLHNTVKPVKQFPGGNNFVYTQPLDSLLTIMMHRSDNFFAEQCLLMVSQQLTRGMNDRVIIQKILSTDFKNLPQTPGWVDGSGLSRYNLFSPQDFVFILNKMKDEFGLDRMKVILPTGGTGTLSSLYKQEKGFIFAKTGTLNGVVALSGYLITAKNKLLIFSVLVNNHRSSAQDIRKGIEQFLIRIRKSN